MTREVFKVQLQRLQNQWGSSYGTERAEILWRAFQSTADHEFSDAVTECLANYRQAPLVKELSHEVNVAKARSAENRAYDMQGGSFADYLADQATHAPNPEFAKECIRLLNKKLNGQLTQEQFNQACDYLDQAAGLTCKDCPDCGESGYCVFENALYRCPCRSGQARPESIFGPEERDGTRKEHRLATLNRASRKSLRVGRELVTGEKEE